MIRPVLWSACTQLPISFKVNWNRRTSITSPACWPIWMRSPSANGRRHMRNTQPARLTRMSLRAMATPAETSPRNVAIDWKRANQIRRMTSRRIGVVMYAVAFCQRYRSRPSWVRRHTMARVMRCTSHSATSTSSVASSLVAVAALKPIVRCSHSPNCVIARSRYEGLPFSSNHDHLRPPPRPVFRHHGRRRRHHRRRHLPDAGRGGGARRLPGACAERLGAGRRGRPDRSLLLRRAGPAPPPGGRRLRRPAGDVGSATRVPVRLDPAARHRHGRDRRDRRDVREVRPGARRAAGAAHSTPGRGRDRPRLGDQLCRRPSRRRHPEHLHDSQAGGPRRPHRRGPFGGAPAAEVMRALLGPAGGTLIAAGIALSTFGFLNLVILVTPRVLQAMAADGLFFPRLAELHPVYRTPAAAILVQAGWAVVLTVSGTFGQLVDYVAFGDWIF